MSGVSVFTLAVLTMFLAHGELRAETPSQKKIDSVIMTASDGKHYFAGQNSEWASSIESFLAVYRESDPESYLELKARLDRHEAEENTAKAKAEAVKRLPKTAQPLLRAETSRPPERVVAIGQVPRGDCLQVEVTVFRDGKPSGTEVREVCE